MKELTVKIGNIGFKPVVEFRSMYLATPLKKGVNGNGEY
jgi:hypothetical protein